MGPNSNLKERVLMLKRLGTDLDVSVTERAKMKQERKERKDGNMRFKLEAVIWSRSMGGAIWSRSMVQEDGEVLTESRVPKGLHSLSCRHEHHLLKTNGTSTILSPDGTAAGGRSVRNSSKVC